MAEQCDIEKLLSEAKEFDYIWLNFTDLHGIKRGKAIPARNIKDDLTNGVGISSGRYCLTMLQDTKSMIYKLIDVVGLLISVNRHCNFSSIVSCFVAEKPLL